MCVKVCVAALLSINVAWIPSPQIGSTQSRPALESARFYASSVPFTLGWLAVDPPPEEPFDGIGPSLLARSRTNSTSERTGIPDGPFAIQGLPSSIHATPAISR